ncbi:dethiobiotin synthase [Campylobacter suis]|uniref:ATP-dependent dethiobiotin synthetase BioD n=1 Tax=Campylobacter suis TaxID=2790657 RepID=A0ABM8Q084_9BACT|nr:dethiobiotin synthase [Campylobacter suis]CAD7286209.1 ATP-dependent dethiobiotin synthetase BioD [Campylobacter suis]
MSKNLFILGTGTDVGKTYVSGLLLKKLLKNELNALYFKPISSGNLRLFDGSLRLCDVEFVREFSGLKTLASKLSVYAYENGYSPHLAANFESNYPDLNFIKDKFDDLQKCCDFLLIEGAGGVVTPLNFSPNGKNLMLLDLVKALCPSVLLVACASLGGINSAVLTCQYLQNNGILIKGIILNHFDEKDPVCVDNCKMIEVLTGVSVIECVSYSQMELNLETKKLENLFS